MDRRYNLEGKVALVTGDGRERGIGKATALRLAREGAHVAVSDICRTMPAHPELGLGDWDGLQAVAEEIRGLGTRSLPLKLDVTDEVQVQEVLDSVMSKFGRLDVLVNNAGGSASHDNILGMDRQAWHDTLETCATGTFLCSRAAAKAMIAGAQGGRIINIASTNGKDAWPGLSAYNAAKAAVILFTQTAAIEFGPHGITVNAVCPGNIDTLMTRIPAERMARGGLVPSVEAFMFGIGQDTCLKRVGTPEDVANVVAFLASSDADYVTGQAINVCGGLLLGAMAPEFEMIEMQRYSAGRR